MIKRYIKNESVVEKDHEESLLLFDINESKMFKLNKISKLLWQKSGKNFDMESLKKIITDNCFQVTNLEKDLENFIKNALKYNIISLII